MAPLLSLAGATQNPAPAPVRQRIGGFGGPAGLAAFVQGDAIDAIVDATHPFAARMSANALAAAQATATPLLVFTRPPWMRQDGDRWIEVDTVDAAANALAGVRRNVFLTQGRLQLAAFARQPQHRYVVRAIDRPGDIDTLQDCRLVLARGPFSLDDEIALMRDEKITMLVTKNSGGEATYPKIEAARSLGVEVIIVRRPKPPENRTVYNLDDAMAWIRAHRDAP